jgi:Uma2 family endonuclease
MSSRSLKPAPDPRTFIVWENRRKGRYELIGGEVRMMAGGSRAHDLIAGNMLVALRLALRGRGCDVHGSNLKLVSPVGMVTYPDLFVRCGSLADDATECDDAVIVVEVLSPSTRSEDLVRKRWGYQAIPTLRHLVYVDASAVKVEVAGRDADGRWWSEFHQSLDATLDLPALGASFPLADVYAGTGAAGG